MIPYRDRFDAGRALASRLSGYADRPDAIVLALARGGVPVAFEVARRLRLPLDVLVVRKLGVPGHEEVAMGAIATGGTRVINQDLVEQLGIPQPLIERIAAAEQRELERRERLYRGHRPPPPVTGHTVILVDDGLATGATMRAAVAGLRTLSPRRIVVAVPVGASQACARLRREADEVVCALVPEELVAVSQWYESFEQTSDDEVRDLLARGTISGVRLHLS